MGRDKGPSVLSRPMVSVVRQKKKSSNYFRVEKYEVSRILRRTHISIVMDRVDFWNLFR